MIAESKKEPDVVLKRTTPRTCLLLVARDRKLTPSRIGKINRLQSFLSELPKLNIPLPAPTTFTIFSKLPPELRDNIWELAAIVPRDINLCRKSYPAGNSSHFAHM